MDKKKVLYFAADENDLNTVAKMMTEHDIDCVTVDTRNYNPIEHKIFNHEFVNKETPCTLYNGIICNFDLSSTANGLVILKCCRHAMCLKISKMPVLLIINGDQELNERQMQEIRDYQFGLLYKPRFDGRHIVQLLFH